MRRRALRWSTIAVLALLAVGTFSFLRLFTQAESSIKFVDWQSAAILGADGTERPLDLEQFYEVPPALGEGECYLFRAVLDQVGPNDDLVLDLADGETSLAMDGTVLLDTAAALPGGAAGLSQARIPLPPDAAGKSVTLRCRPAADGTQIIFPPILRLSSLFVQEAETTAYGNLYGMPAGALAVVFLVVCFLFFTGLVSGAPDWPLVVLALATAIITVNRLVVGLGYSFLPQRIYQILVWPGFEFLAPALLLAYLALNRKRAFWRRLGWCTAGSLAALLCAWLVSLLQGGYLGHYLPSLADEVLHGYFRGLLYWLTVYLIAACAGIATFGVIESVTKIRAEASALAVKADLTARNFQTIEEHDRQAAALRHELSHHITALYTMHQAGKQEELGQYLEELRRQESGLHQVRFTKNIPVNAILQDAAARAAAQGIRFDAKVQVPEQLSIPDGDLCCLLMNLLDNALEAAAPVEQDPFIRFHCQLKNGFLGIKCENSYTGSLSVDPATGALRSTKPDSSAHGFGMKQIRSTAEKYQSLLNISYTDTVFTAQTALKLPD